MLVWTRLALRYFSRCATRPTLRLHVHLANSHTYPNCAAAPILEMKRKADESLGTEEKRQKVEANHVADGGSTLATSDKPSEDAFRPVLKPKKKQQPGSNKRKVGRHGSRRRDA